ncbi:hypothetical protein GIB67_024074 [Kingdonia uniflora]|uniref:Uncharacterized protein n=1 Tax=Kingdonia uniflora TaxID=39325 RepID=A0A7J7MMR9_9MAGN|nr:hypothetical protein GIB67_024074 [Kingdonia uniflora]
MYVATAMWTGLMQLDGDVICFGYLISAFLLVFLWNFSFLSMEYLAAHFFYVHVNLLFPVHCFTRPLLIRTLPRFCCGSCGYPLNLISSNCITSGKSSKQKSIKKASISFCTVDLSRFTQVDQVNCFPISWGSCHLKTKLLCRKCGVIIGYGYGDSSSLCGFDSTSSSSSYKKFTIKIRSLKLSE